MKTYEVSVEINIIKWITVEAENEDAAREAVFESGISTLTEDGVPERYSEEIVGIKEVS